MGGGGAQSQAPKVRAAWGERGGSRGMVPWKFMKYRVSEIAFSAFQVINFQQFLTN